MLGRNVKITLPQSARSEARALCEALAFPVDTSKPEFDIAAPAGGGRLGFFYVADDQALTPAQMRIAPWLEIAVEDVTAAGERLDRIGLKRLDHVDKEHPYFVGPGGVVFRLARLAG